MKKFNIVMVMIFSLFMLVACQQDDGVTTVSFQTDSHAEVTIYEDAALTQAVTTNSIDLEEGVTEIYFKVSYDTLYDADDISLGSSNNVTLTIISETNHVYKLSGINSDLTVTITSTLESGSTT